jgi:ABC-type lipoprotein release transport system permease subunit
MDVSLIPLGFVVVIIFLAILVGIVTGLYPAKRAKHISALNALRYE